MLESNLITCFKVSMALKIDVKGFILLLWSLMIIFKVIYLLIMRNSLIIVFKWLKT